MQTQQNVLKVTWDWRARRAEDTTATRPGAGKVVVEAAIPAVIGLILFLGLGHRTIGAIVLGLVIVLAVNAHL